MRRLFQRAGFVGLILLAVLAGTFFAFGDRLAGALTRRALVRLENAANARGMKLEAVTFSHASFAGLFAIRCDQVRGEVGLTQATGSDMPGRLVFGAEYLLVDVHTPWSDTARVAIFGGELAGHDVDATPEGDRLTRINAEVEFPFSWRQPGATAAMLQEELRRLYREGRTQLPLRASAVAHFRAGRQWHELPIRAQRAAPPGNGAELSLEREDVARISRAYTYPLTESEITLVAQYPARAPRLLRLCETATSAAQAHRRQNRGFPYDAFRHIYWSWLLTREFGAEFAELVTDAHEIGATYETGEAARRMDLHNNAVGRVWAIAGVTEAQLLQRVLTDPYVVRAPTATTP